MVEQKRTQLFMMLVQQAGVGSLPMSHLGRAEFLGFMRKIEKAALEVGAPTIVYWSSRDSRELVPKGGDYNKLTRQAFCVSGFSENRDDKTEEFCFLVESRGLCLVLYGHHSEEHGPEVFQCVGSVDPDMVRRAFQMMLPVWQFLDLGETNRLEDARNNAGPPSSSPKAVQECRNEWPVVKIAVGGPRFMPDPQRDTGEIMIEQLTAPPPGPSAGSGSPGGGGGAGRPTGSFVDALRSLSPSGPGASSAPSFSTDLTSFLDPDGAFPEGVVETAYVGGGEKLSTTLAAPPVTETEVTFVRAEVPKTRPTKSKVDKRGLKELRNVWTTISEESRSVFPPEAQRIIRDIFGQLRHSSDHHEIMQLAIEELTKVAMADRGLIWQVIGDQLTVTHEFATSGHTPFVDSSLNSNESSSIISEFLSRFPDETGSGVIAIPDTRLDEGLYKKSPQLATLLELSSTNARLVAQLRCIGRFHGFLELQQSNPREWSEEDAALLQSVSETLSVVVQQSFDLRKREMDASEMKLINTISELFRESKGERMKGTLARSVENVAEHMGFVNAQIFLYSEDDRELIPQMQSAEHNEPVSLDDKDNPFVRQFVEGRGKVRMINVEYTRKGDAFFGHDMALVVPLEHEGETLGVLGLWKRSTDINRAFRPGDDDKLALTICNNMSSIIRADQAIFKIRQDGLREQLINRVTQVIRQSPKEVDQILEELVQALHEYFTLSLSVVSLFDQNNTQFVKSKLAGTFESDTDGARQKMAEELFVDLREEFSNGNVLILDRSETEKRLAARGVQCPDDVNMVIIAPLIHRENLKAALSLWSVADKQFPPADMKMVVGLAERVAADLAHKELFEQVERQAVTDPMTGLFNRRYFGEQFSREIDRNQRFGHPFSYIIIDLDFLKKINDNLGHQFGDAAIKHIANVIKKCVRDVDTTARYGGEEFVVLLPETDIQGARVVAERMCVAIRETPVDGCESEDIKRATGRDAITASIGVSTFPYDAQDRDKLTELADQALYLAKKRGRNQVCSVSEDLRPVLSERGEEALEVQQATIKAKAEEFAAIDLKLIAEHGLLGILGAVIKMIEAKDAYSTDRSPRAADYAGKLASALHLSREHSTIISLSAILNNIGKIGVPEEILQKKDALTEEELAIIRNTPMVGAKLLEPAKHLHRVAAVVESYHEHWDGSGYPKGLRGEQIPLESRIIGLVDAYVAMTSDRPHRPAMTVKEAAAVIQAGAGKEWDPRLVKLFLSVLHKEGKT